MNQGILKLFGLSCFLVSCASISRHDYKYLEIPDQDENSPHYVLNEKQLKADLGQLVYGLESAYSGRRFLPSGEFENLLHELKEIKAPLTSEEFCTKVGSLFNSVSDHHLQAKLNRKRCFENAMERTGRVGFNAEGPHAGHSDVKVWAMSQEEKYHALVIGIISLPNRKDPAWTGFFPALKGYLRRSDYVVIDLRENSGGDDAILVELAQFFAGKQLKSPYSNLWRSETPESYQLMVNHFEDELRQEERQGKMENLSTRKA